MKGIEALFHPRSIALVGASGIEGKIGRIILGHLDRWEGRLFLVSPREREIMGREVLGTVSELPDGIDLAVIALSAKKAVEAAKACARKGVKALIILAAGFAEAGDAGKRLEAELEDAVLSRGTRILGPNTLGVFVPGTGLDTIFVEHGDAMFSVPGEITLITQSGSVGVEAIGVSGVIGWGLRAFVGMGNRIDIGENELLEHFASDEGTRCIALYLETFQDGHAFIDLCRRTTPTKPVVVLKVGRSEAAQRAIASHTGRMASPMEVFWGASRQAGVILAGSEEQLTDYAKILSREPTALDPRVAVVTFAGGYGVITLDLIAETGRLELARLSEDTVARMAVQALPFASLSNPVDLTASADINMVAEALEALEEDPGVGIVFCIAFFAPPKIGRDLIDVLARHRSRTIKPFVVFVAYGPFTDEIAHTLYEKGVTAFTSLSRAIRAMDALAERGHFLKTMS